MRLSSLEVTGLFGIHNHRLEFPQSDEDNPKPTIMILYGANGVWKTTLLRMLNGIMHLDFNPFRSVPFASCRLTLSDQAVVDVRPTSDKTLTHLDVTFRDHTVQLHPTKPGP